MDASAYALAHGVRHTRATLTRWQRAPGRVVARWVAGSAVAAVALLLAVLVVASLEGGYVQILQLEPPFEVGGLHNVLTLLSENMLVLALHAMACVAGFIAGSSLPLQAAHKHGRARWLHEHGGRIAIAFVGCATAFSLSAQAYVIGRTLAGVSGFLRRLTRHPAAGRAPPRDPRADRAVPAAGRLDPRQPPRRVGSAARRDRRDGGDSHPRAGDRRAHRGVRLAAPVHDAHATSTRRSCATTAAGSSRSAERASARAGTRRALSGRRPRRVPARRRGGSSSPSSSPS